MLPDDLQLSKTDKVDDGKGIFLHVVLIDAMSGIVKVIRSFTLDVDFSREFYRAIALVLDRPISKEEYASRLGSLYRKYPTVDAMIAVCKNLC